MERVNGIEQNFYMVLKDDRNEHNSGLSSVKFVLMAPTICKRRKLY